MTFSKQFSLNIFFFSTKKSKMPRNMCKLRYKVRNGHFHPMKVQISSISKVFFKLNFWFNFRLSKTYSFNPSLKNRLYVFESLRQVKKIWFEKSEYNSEIFTWSLLAVLPKTSMYQSVLYRNDANTKFFLQLVWWLIMGNILK